MKNGICMKQKYGKSGGRKILHANTVFKVCLQGGNHSQFGTNGK